MSLPTVPSHAVDVAPVVGASGMLQAGLGMLLVLGLIFLCAWLARRFGLQRFGGGQVVKVVSSASVGQRERVVVVEVAGTWLVLGVTSNQINALHTLPAQVVPSASGASDSEARKPIDLFARKLHESLTGKARPAS
jgi:flagellar protein FliO/FliZ